jgi:hypothetical protein
MRPPVKPDKRALVGLIVVYDHPFGSSIRELA